VSTRRKIAALRALAASTRFPEEAQSARDKADKLERELRPEVMAMPGITLEALQQIISDLEGQITSATEVRMRQTEANRIMRGRWDEMIKAMKRGTGG
jgi:hypothetical protein